MDDETSRVQTTKMEIDPIREHVNLCVESLAKELRSVAVKTSVKIEKMRKLRSQVEAKAKELGVDVDTIIAGAMFSRTNNIMKAIDKIKTFK